jgi:uncharacterized repeat protein (TIGR03806 family)
MKSSISFLSWIFALAFFFSCQNSTEKPEPQPQSRALEPEEASGIYPYRRLSTYGIFEGEMKNLKPTAQFHFYKPASSLFTDYANKSRFIFIPEGQKAKLNLNELELPHGTILVKNFFYPEDFRKPEGERRIIETRLMIHEEGGWQAYPYIWNEEQTDAILKIVGGTTQVHFTDQTGKNQVINYIIPNKNQCKSCHNQDEKLVPIGVQTKHLNHEANLNGSPANQLIHWEKLGILEKSVHPDQLPAMINYEDEKQALDDRAMAYLDINCAHCHRAEGPASTSGLFLSFDQKDPLKLGINKAPVAAGKGAGSFKYDIVPGQPDQSILTHRMNSTEVGVAMPEIGRTTVHREGVELIKAWISRLE